jgi:pimeloyl-ACP methyl ester carboxylesterase
MSARPRTFVLVPGAWHGAWCWQGVVPLLGARGHRVLTPELAATGADLIPPDEIRLDTWARQIHDLLEQQPEPVILVGHSRAGVIISRVAELAPDRIARLVFLAAYLLPAGGNVADAAREDAGSLIAPNMIPATPGITCTLRPEALREAFYGDCDEPTVKFALAQLHSEPLRPLATPLRISEERFGRVPRAYIECTRDRTISLAAQRKMQAVLPCHPVFTLESDHSPFLSHPRELADALGAMT